MAKVPVALQLFSVRGEVQKDLPSTIESVSKLGYVGAEPWGYGGEDLTWMGHTCQEIRKVYEDNGLACCGIHLQPGALVGDNLKRTVEFNQVLGNRFLIIAGDKERMSTLEGVQDLANTLNQAIPEICKILGSVKHGEVALAHRVRAEFMLRSGREA